MTRSRVQQNYSLDNTSLTLDTFTSTTGWAGTNCTIATDEYGLKITTTVAGGVGVATKTLAAPLDLSAYCSGGYIEFEIYVHDATTLSSNSGMYLFLGNSASFTRFANQARSWTPTTGLQKVRFWLSGLDNNGTVFSVSTPINAYKLWVLGATSKTTVVSIVSMAIYHAVVPKCIITFDDGIASQYSVAFPYMAAKGLKGVIYATKNVNTLTTAQLQELYAAGWDIGNHSTNHVVFAGKSATWAITNGSTTATPSDAGSYNGYGVGQTVTGTGIQAGTTITEVNTTNVKLSLPATATNASVSVTVATPVSVMEYEILTCREWLLSMGFDRSADHLAYPFGQYIDSMGTACAATGVLTARTTVSGNVDVPAANPYALPMGFTLGATATLAAFITAFETARRRGQTIFLMGHAIVASGATGSSQINESVFNSIIDYIAASGVDVPTISEWSNGLTDPRIAAATRTVSGTRTAAGARTAA